MSDIETEITPDLGAEQYFEPEGDQWSPSREEWENLRDGVGYVAAEMQARQQAAEAEYAGDQQAAYEDAIRDAFDPYSEAFDPDRAMQMVAELVQGQIAPVQQQLAERQYQDALDDAADYADDVLLELGVPEDKLDEVLGDAQAMLQSRAVELVLAQHGYTREQVAAAMQGPDQQMRGWGEQMAQWAEAAASELCAQRPEAALIALEEAAKAALSEEQDATWYQRGGTVADRIFGRGQPSIAQGVQGHDYRAGGTVTDRMFTNRGD